MADMTADLTARARAGDGTAFTALTEPLRRELQVHCYRMLGSLQDAEDAVQDTLLAAWQGFGGFEGRASLRTWLYTIATNRCLNARRRAARPWDVPDVEPPAPTRLGAVVWLEPYPDALLPEAHLEHAETISLAFVTALQLLPPRQRAVLILRDVLAYRADETAGMLDTTTESVTSALKRARATLQRRRPEPPLTPGSPTEQILVGRLTKAFQSGDVDGLITLLTDDVRLSMPPIPLEYDGRDAVAGFYTSLMNQGHRYDLVPTRANTELAFGAYLRSPGSAIRHGAGLIVISTRGDRISAITRFDNTALPWFGLPRALPAVEVR